LIATRQTFENPEPVITTEVPTRPSLGVNCVILGFTLKPSALEAPPEGVVRLDSDLDEYDDKLGGREVAVLIGDEGREGAPRFGQPVAGAVERGHDRSRVGHVGTLP
jgi:hypothetical protein